MERATPEILLPPGVQAPPKEQQRYAIAVPSMDQCVTNFAMALAQLHYRLGIRRIPVALINNKGSIVAINRNNGIAEAQRLGCSKILFLDSDMTFPADTLERLLAHDKKIVGATYAQRSGLHKNLSKPKGNERDDASGLVEVDALPTGCLLIDLSVFEDMPKPYFRFGVNPVTERITGEDYNFCDDVRALGHSIWLDVELSWELIHWGESGWVLDPDLCGRDPQQPDARLVELETFK